MSVSTPQKLRDEKPVPLYKDCRDRIYDWVRNECISRQMSFEVFALAMTYIDEYHIDHKNPYDRVTFRNLARSSIILASKLSVRRVISITMYA